jgi:hypothetical protein
MQLAYHHCVRKVYAPEGRDPANVSGHKGGSCTPSGHRLSPTPRPHLPAVDPAPTIVAR